MSKRVMIFLAIGFISIITAFFLHRADNEPEAEAETEPEVKPRKTVKIPKEDSDIKEAEVTEVNENGPGKVDQE